MKKLFPTFMIFLLITFTNLFSLNRDYKFKCDEEDDSQDSSQHYCIDHAPEICLQDRIGEEIAKLIPATGPECCECDNPSIYMGYIDDDFNKYFSHFGHQLIYYANNRNCTCYWPEYCTAAAKISDCAYLLFRDLISTTALSKLLESEKEQKKFNRNRFCFLNKHGLTLSFIVQQFRFSDYYHVCKDIEKYAQFKYEEREAAKIKDKLEDILEALYPKFFDLYTACFIKHPSADIEQEIRLMKLLAGDISGLDNIMTSANISNPSYNQPYDISEFIISNLSTAEIPVELESKGIRKTKNHNTLNRSRAFEASLNAQVSLIVVKGSFSAQSEILLEQGSILNDLLLYKKAIEVLTEAIKLNPYNRNAYIERAMAYFETNQLPLALKDYEQAKKRTIIPPLKVESQQALVMAAVYIPENKKDFATGLLSGTLEGAKISATEFAPSVLSCCRGILNGLWAFVLSPVEISQEMVKAAYAIGEYVASHSTIECLQCVVPELKELSLTWKKLNDYARGQKIGYIIGKYGVDVFAPIGVIKGANKIRTLKRANTMCTLEGCVASPANQAKILEEGHSFATKRQIIISEIASKGKIYPKNANAISHILQDKHAWDKVVKIKKPIKAKNNIEENFKSVITLLEKENIMSNKYFTENIYSGSLIKSNKHTKVISGHKVEVIFEINTETNTILIQDGWVLTK